MASILTEPSGDEEGSVRDHYTPTEPSEALEGSVRGHYSHRALRNFKGLGQKPLLS